MTTPPRQITARAGYKGFGLTRYVFTESGIRVKPWFGSAFDVPWSDVDFVSPTPAWERAGDGWELASYRGLQLPRLRFQVLDVVLKDRHALTRGKSFASRFWLLGRVKALYDADDRQEFLRGNLELIMGLKGLSTSPDQLIALIAEHARLDLLVHGE